MKEEIFLNMSKSWPEITDIFGILICCELAYHFKHGVICITRCCKSQIVCVGLVIYKLPLSLEVKQGLPMYLMYYWIRFSQYPSCNLVCQNVGILYTIRRQIAISTDIENAEWL